MLVYSDEPIEIILQKHRVLDRSFVYLLSQSCYHYKVHDAVVCMAHAPTVCAHVESILQLYQGETQQHWRYHLRLHSLLPRL
jgi:hypothetical protein